MHMDDPWGSPWAQPPSPDNVEGENGVVDTRPRTPVTAKKVLGDVETSPWADDGGNRVDWDGSAVGDGRGATVRSRELQLGGLGEGWDLEDVEGTGDTPKEELGKVSPGWGDALNIADVAVTKLAPSPLFSPAKTPRQLTPDPWAQESVSSAVHVLEEDYKSGHDTEEKRKSIEDLEWSNGGFGQLPGSIQKPIPMDERVFSTVPPDQLEETFDAVQTSGKASDNAQEGAIGSSRPSSSSPSDNSRHGEAIHESPRTSLEEEQGPIEGSTCTPSKVRELVQYFDGRSNKETAAPDAVGQTPACESDKDEDDGPGEDDFGDFEEGMSDTGVATPDVQCAKEESSMNADDSDSAVKSPGSRRGNIAESPGNDRNRVIVPAEFFVDTAALEKLYPGSYGRAPTESIFIPDTIPYDSFSSTEERKTWYRISRYGSMRKHNSGDDENYVRMNWRQSAIRTETLKIVGRWMEEDRISGRVVLGGVSKGSSVFGWNDPKAEMVPLSSGFRGKKSQAATQSPIHTAEPDKAREWPKTQYKDRSQTSTQTSTATPDPEIPREWPQVSARRPSSERNNTKESPHSKSRRRSSAKTARISQEVKSIPEVPVATFGWSTAPEKPQATNGNDELNWISDLGIQAEVLQSSPPAQSLVATNSSSIPVQSDARPSNASRVGATVGLATTYNSYPVEDFAALDFSSAPLAANASAPLPPTLPVVDSSQDDDDWGEMVSSPVTTSPPVLPYSTNISSQPLQNIDDIFSAPLTGGTAAVASNNIAPLSSDSFFPSQTSPASTKVASGAERPPMSLVSPNSTLDPWASADFSFFDAAPAPVPAPAPVTTLSSKSKAVQKGASTLTANTSTPKPTLKGKLKEDIEIDRAVQNIIKGLPDLSYMLRR